MFNYTQRWQIILVSQKIADRPPRRQHILAIYRLQRRDRRPFSRPIVAALPKLVLAPTYSNQVKHRKIGAIAGIAAWYFALNSSPLRRFDPENQKLKQS